jgi:hypothetical protein
MRIQFLSPEADINPDNDNVDVLLHLDDGRTFLFVAFTPNNIYSCMENEGIDYFLGAQPLFVRKLTRDNLETAFRALLEDPNQLEVYGTLQRGDEDRSGVSDLRNFRRR